MKTQQNTKQVYIIHGYWASPEHHWFPWLKEMLLEKGVAVDVLSMPTPITPKIDEWTKHLMEHVSVLNKNTYFVAHSLGCISLLKYLEHLNSSEQIGGFVLVSGFTKKVPNYQFLNEFTQHQLDYKLIIEMVENRAVIASKDDPIVPFPLSQKLAEEIQADFHQTDGCGHFLANDGFTTFPLAYNILVKMMNLV